MQGEGERERESHTGQPEQHSPLSRGLREFTESRRPLPPRRGLACCSSFAVHPFLIHLQRSHPEIQKPLRSGPVCVCEAILGSVMDGSKWGDLKRRSRDGERGEEERMVEKSNLRHLAGNALLLSISWTSERFPLTFTCKFSYSSTEKFQIFPTHGIRHTVFRVRSPLHGAHTHTQRHGGLVEEEVVVYRGRRECGVCVRLWWGEETVWSTPYTLLLSPPFPAEFLFRGYDRDKGVDLGMCA